MHPIKALASIVWECKAGSTEKATRAFDQHWATYFHTQPDHGEAELTRFKTECDRGRFDRLAVLLDEWATRPQRVSK